MKKLLFLLLFFVTYSNHSQTITPSIGIGIPISKKTEFQKAIIHFNDSTSIEGIGRLKTIFTSQEEVIIFKIEEKDKDETWTVKEAQGITIVSDDEVIHYEYLKVTKNSYAELYEVVTEGDVKLYKKRRVYRNSGTTTSTTSKSVPIGNTGRTAGIPSTTTSSGIPTENEKLTYYVKRENEPYPTKIRDNYIKSFAEYMKDCDVAVEKIKNHEYNFSELKDLVDYYNANCGE
ncbi:hypothetical protein [Flavobacterium sangjuense]|uniref:Uncharacterized protein n=1 Tax=Flavobacterium sangjuense TaxID=2518177 RepID=A0A4P7PS91_9FLAO|nr:hypothetical protein [Flavobacterium sangjuense]QBZ97767.1 hypothetical protein GS03_01265 [Flavobacterium sangjuense]